jgi:hypothetical protein
MDRQEVMKQVEEIGKTVARMADPGYWRCENRDRAALYVPALTAMRKCWSEIKSSKDMEHSLRAAMKSVDGIERNHLRLLVIGVGAKDPYKS